MPCEHVYFVTRAGIGTGNCIASRQAGREFFPINNAQTLPQSINNPL